MAVYARQPFAGTKILYPANPDWAVPAVEAVFALPDGKQGRLFAVHPVPPVRPSWKKMRDAYLMEIAGLAEESSLPVVVAGDFNMTPWSPAFGKVLGTGHLSNAREGWGLLPSWPAFYPWPLRIPLDQVLLGTGLEVSGLRLLPKTGSDHRVRCLRGYRRNKYGHDMSCPYEYHLRCKTKTPAAMTGI